MNRRMEGWMRTLCTHIFTCTVGTYTRICYVFMNVCVQVCTFYLPMCAGTYLLTYISLYACIYIYILQVYDCMCM
jgi:hypothetical protein